MARRFRRALRLRPVHTRKHYVQFSGTAAKGGIDQVTLVDVVGPGEGDFANQIEAGSHVKNLFLELWFSATGSTPPAASSFDSDVQRYQDGQPSPSAGDLGNLGNYSNRKNILWHTRGLPQGAGNPIPVMRGWIKNPKPRFGEGDGIGLYIAPATSDLRYCGFATFKEYQ